MTNWPVKTLGEVCEFVRGVTYDKNDARSELKNEYIPLLRATNITESGLLREELVFVPKSGVRADQKLMSGDALITIASGSASVVGRSVLVEDPGEMTFGAFCGVLRPGPELFPRYLSHFMSSRSVRTAWSEAAQGTNINNLKRDDILRTECPVPPLEEQKRIVALLDQATTRISELTACYEQARTHANDLFTSALRDELESNHVWRVRPLGSIFRVCSSKRVLKSEWRQSGVPFYRGREITALSKYGAVDNELFIAEEHFTELVQKHGAPKAGDIMITAIGTIGNSYVVKDVDRFYFKDASVIWLDKREAISSEYVNFWIMSPAFTGQLKSGNGATVDTLTIDGLSKMDIPVPPIEEQLHIVARLEAMKVKTSEMVSIFNSKLTAAHHLRQSILESAFAGDP